MSKIVGRSGSLLLVSNGDFGVVIDTKIELITETGLVASLAESKTWKKTNEVLPTKVLTLVASAFSTLTTEPVVAAAPTENRMFTIPAGVQAEAKKALAWHAAKNRGGTPVGLNTARTLAEGGQVGIHVVRHIAKYFPRHEVDKKAPGFKPGDSNFPSKGRVAWALWGGDAGWRWAKSIVARDDRKAVRADGSNYGADVDAFRQAYELEADVAPEFLARVRLDGSGIDRLYKIDLDGSVFVWDSGSWQDLGHVDGDVYTYDKALDDPYDSVGKTHLAIDPDSAIIISAKLQQNPFDYISIAEIDAEEAALARNAISDLDWGFVDDIAVVAAGESPLGDTVKAPDGYTPAERSQNAEKQVRDGGGKFAGAGKRVADPNGKQGTVTKVDGSTGNVTVKYDDGSSAVMPAKATKQVDANTAPASVGPSIPVAPINTTGILAQPKAPAKGSSATLPGQFPALSSADTSKLLADYSAWAAGARTGKSLNDVLNGPTPSGKSANSKTPLDLAPASEKVPSAGGKAIEKATGQKLITDAYQHPLLKDWLGQSSNIAGQQVSNALWYQPITAAADGQAQELTPETTDVQPLYMAIVSPDDPRAVLDLVALIPASSVSPEPMAYTRQNKQWVRDVKTLADLQSATPPPVVPLTADALNSVLQQVDATADAAAKSATPTTASALTSEDIMMLLWGPREEIIASAQAEFVSKGGWDKNKGNAEKLREYWTHGEGAAKIRWGQGGDWSRCVRYLSKYLGVRAKGYCQLRHHDATGIYTATHAKLDHAKKNAASNQEFIMEEVLTKNYGKPTVVTDKDMLTPVPDLMGYNDDVYDHHWEPSDDIKKSLKEMAKLGEEDFKGIITAAGGLDQNRGDAEKLRHYWTHGKGGAKIRWNSKGDWTRCVRHLGKYLGPRAAGYCALRHKEMTGMWTGDKLHRQMYGRTSNGKNVFSNQIVKNSKLILDSSVLTAQVADAKSRVSAIIAGATDQVTPPAGASFSIPLVIPEGMESGDGRSFEPGAISIRELPLPLMWQIKTGDGHSGSVVVGRIDHMERTDQGIGNATGVFDTGAFGKEAERLVANGFLKGVSADMDQFEAKEQEAGEAAEGDGEDVGLNKLIINKARVMGVTIVPKPAFQECKIFLDGESSDNQEDTVIPDGVYVDEVDPTDASSLVACAFVAGAIPVVPPTNWFKNPKLSKPTPLTVDDSGRVFGHIAAWHVDHIGMAFGTRPPRSKSNYSYFHTGVVRTEDGTDVPVGQLTLAGGHAGLEASASEAVKHYDDTASAIADVHAGEDQFGIWVAGSLRPGAQPDQIRALRASAPSGDWRPIKGQLELVAVCQVNVPGFPIARARVASGAVMALVAAGAMSLAKLKADPVTELAARLEKLESANSAAELSVKADELRNRFKETTAELAYIPQKVRDEAAKKGHALPDGSFPIETKDDVESAIHAYGRAKESHKAAVRKHIIKRARQLKVSNLIPDNWKTASSDAITASLDAMRAKIEAVSINTESSTFADETPELDPTDLRARAFAAQEALGKTLAAEDNTVAEFADAPASEETPAAPAAPAAPEDSVAPATESKEEAKTPDENGIPTDKGQNVDPFKQEGQKYTPESQPRDDSGKFRDVLARLNQDLGVAGLASAQQEAAKAENLHDVGNYADSAKAAQDLLGTLDRLDSGALDNKSMENVRVTAGELGKLIDNLPLGFDDQAQKVGFSELPPVLRNIMTDMVSRVEQKIGQKDADVATSGVRDFMNGGQLYSQADISSQMSKMLRLLT